MLHKVMSLYREAYSGLPRGAWILALAEFINRSGFMVLIFLNIYLTGRLDFSLAQAGRVLSANGLGSIAGGYLGGHLTDRIGVRKVQVGSLIFSGLLLVVAGYAKTYGLLLLLLFLYGLTSAALFPANDTAMSRFCRGEMRSKGFALRRLASNLGITFGPVVGGYLILLDYLYIFWIDGLTSLAAAAVIVLCLGVESSVRQDAVSESQPPSRSPWRDGVFLAFLGLFLVLITVFSHLFSAFPLYLHTAIGLRESRIGPLWAINTLMIVLFEMALLHALRKRSEIKLVALGALLIGLGFGLMPLGRSYAYIALTVVVWTMGEILTIPLTATVAANRAGAAAGRYMGMLSMAFSLAIFIAPLTGNWALGTIGGDALWFLIGGIGLACAAGFWMLRRKLAAAPGS
jgi:predicted MFS family arabinose efflux permease